MSIEEIASYCGIMGCRVSFGDSETGFVHMDGNGIQGKLNNYRRFLAHHELSALTAPKTALQTASIFRIECEGEIREFSREKFQELLGLFKNAIHA